MRAPQVLTRFFTRGGERWWALLISLMMVGSGLFVAQNHLLLGSTLNKNWRGSYDILVTASQDSLAQCEDSTQRLMAGNFAGFSAEERLSLADLQRIRSVRGIAVAAPIAHAGAIHPAEQQLAVRIPVTEEERSGVAYELEGEFSVDNGLAEHSVSQFKDRVFLKEVEDSPELVGGHPLGGAFTSGGTHSVEVVFPSMPSGVISVIALDPVAEQELLDGHGEFLDPLVEINHIPVDSLMSLENSPVYRERRDSDPELAITQIVTPRDADREIVGGFFPLILNESAGNKVELSLTSRELDIVEDDDEPEVMLRSSSLSGVEHSAIFDLTHIYSPYSFSEAYVDMPGRPPTTNAGRAHYFQEMNLRPHFGSTPLFNTTDNCELSIVPQGYVDALGEPLPELSPDQYAEIAFRHRNEVSGFEFDDFDLTMPRVLGKYSSANVQDLVQNVNYVPLGVYEESATTVVESSHEDFVGRMLQPGLSGMGLTIPSAGALTSLEAAVALRGPNIIDAVRVRVADVADYTEQGRERVAAVANELAEMGFAVQIVAGSSQVLTDIQIDGPIDVSAPEDIATVSQEWTALDVATTLEKTHDRFGFVMSWTIAASGMLFAVLISVRTLAAQRHSDQLLLRLGWTRRQRWWWLMGPSFVAVAIVTATAALMTWAARYWGAELMLPWWVYFALPLLFLIVAAGSLKAAQNEGKKHETRLSRGRVKGLGTTVRRRTSSKRSSTSATPVGIALRRVIQGKSGLLTTLLGLTVSAVSIGMVIAFLVQYRHDAGLSRLARVTSADSLPGQLMLIVATALTALIFAVIVQKTGQQQVRNVSAVLHRLGWSSANQRRWILTEAIPAYAAATLVTALSCWAISTAMSLELMPLLLGAVITLALSVSLNVGARIVEMRK